MRKNHKHMKKQLSKALSCFVAVVFLSNILFADFTGAQGLFAPQKPTLSAWTFTERALIQREFLGKLYRENRLIWAARSERYKNELKKNNARALVLPSGRYLIDLAIEKAEKRGDYLPLIRAVTHEDCEILMQEAETWSPEEYEDLFDEVMDNAAIWEAYLKVANIKDIGKKEQNVIFNDLVSVAFELLLIVDKSVVLLNELDVFLCDDEASYEQKTNARLQLNTQR